MTQSPSSPLFILAPPRSYTSVACAMLGQHPALFGLPEVNLFVAERVTDLLAHFATRPGLKHGLLRAVAELGAGDQSVDSVQAADEWLTSHATVSTAEIFADLAAWAAPRLLVDKSPVYSLRAGALERIGRRFEDARFLHLTRHPVTTLDSLARFRRKLTERLSVGRANIAVPDESDLRTFWLEPHRAILRFLVSIPDQRKLRMRGEDLLANSTARLRDIAAWLGVDGDEASVDAMLHPERSPFAGEGPPGARYGNDPEFLASPSLRPVRPGPVPDDHDLPADVRDCARELGYLHTIDDEPAHSEETAPTVT